VWAQRTDIASDLVHVATDAAYTLCCLDYTGRAFTQDRWRLTYTQPARTRLCRFCREERGKVEGFGDQRIPGI
jgi:hypothetical protein